MLIPDGPISGKHDDSERMELNKDQGWLNLDRAVWTGSEQTHQPSEEKHSIKPDWLFDLRWPNGCWGQKVVTFRLYGVDCGLLSVAEHAEAETTGEIPSHYLLKVVDIPLEDLHTPLLGSERPDVPDAHWTWRSIDYIKHNSITSVKYTLSLAPHTQSIELLLTSCLF